MKSFFVFLALLSPYTFADDPAPPVFRLHLLVEPHSLDPQATTSSSGNYVIQNILRGLTKYDSEKGLMMEGAESCRTLNHDLKIECKLSPNHKWSDGQPVKASEYVRSFQRLLQITNKSPQAELLFAVKNAHEVWLQRKPLSELGVEAPDEKTVIFNLQKTDPEFLLKLTHPSLAPMRLDHFPNFDHASEFFSTGPYRIKKWEKGNLVVLEKNPYYKNGREDRPTVEALFIEEDSTALRLYEAGKLTFLRRFPSAQIPAFRNRPDFVQLPMARFDYLGFGPQLKPYPKLRKALSLSLDFENFSKLFDALGRPGCPSLPEKLYDGPLCLNFDPAMARKLLKEQAWPDSINKQLEFSKMGGDDIQRAAEWFQGQWKKNLGLAINIEGQEQGGYVQRLRSDPPPLFRKGIGLERPTCLAALENFAKGSPENYIQLDSPEYFAVVDRLSHETNAAKAKKLCTQAIRILIDENRVIPLGEIHFTMLANPHFPGWKINSINQLDLANVHYQ
jgi:oligopeptide transport system substrate-binding protein